MRHGRNTTKLGRTSEHKQALLANLACSLIEHHRIKTTVAKAKALRPYVEKLVTKARRGTLHDRRIVAGRLGNNSLRVEKVVRKLFTEIAPLNATRPGGYTRIYKLGPRLSDAAPMALIEFVEQLATPQAIEEPKPSKATAKKAPAKKDAGEDRPKAKKPKAEAPADEAAPAEKKPRKPRAKKEDDK
ncbi:MAG: 50S ribosomal protein L17 [Chthoniobacteraceae bacterium]